MENAIQKLNEEITWYKNGLKKYEHSTHPRSKELTKMCKEKIKEFKQAVKILKTHINP